MFLATVAVLSTHIEGNLTVDGGDFVDVEFSVPADTAAINP